MRDEFRRFLNARIYCTTTKDMLRVPVCQNPTANRGETVAAIAAKPRPRPLLVLCVIDLSRAGPVAVISNRIGSLPRA